MESASAVGCGNGCGGNACCGSKKKKESLRRDLEREGKAEGCASAQSDLSFSFHRALPSSICSACSLDSVQPVTLIDQIAARSAQLTVLHLPDIGRGCFAVREIGYGETVHEEAPMMWATPMTVEKAAEGGTEVGKGERERGATTPETPPPPVTRPRKTLRLSTTACATCLVPRMEWLTPGSSGSEALGGAAWFCCSACERRARETWLEAEEAAGEAGETLRADLAEHNERFPAAIAKEWYTRVANAVREANGGQSGEERVEERRGGASSSAAAVPQGVPSEDLPLLCYAKMDTPPGAWVEFEAKLRNALERAAATLLESGRAAGVPDATARGGRPAATREALSTESGSERAEPATLRSSAPEPPSGPPPGVPREISPEARALVASVAPRFFACDALARLHVNAFRVDTVTLPDPRLSPTGYANAISRAFVQTADRGNGTGVFALASLFNHSCDPTCEVAWPHNDARMRIVARRDVAKGEQLTISYIDLEDSGEVRREKLRHAYGFVCNCQRCQSGE